MGGTLYRATTIHSSAQDRTSVPNLRKPSATNQHI